MVLSHLFQTGGHSFTAALDPNSLLRARCSVIIYQWSQWEQMPMSADVMVSSASKWKLAGRELRI